VHPQSILHALVELRDGSMLAQLAPPDMRLPIQQALSHPESWGPAVKACDLAAVGRLDFEAPDPQRFPCLGLAQEAFRQGGTMPAVANAADEVLVGRFLAGEIPFLGIPAGIEAVMAGHSVISDPSLEQVLAADQAAREMAADWTSPGRAGAGRPGERP
jgi:1-deoxy-D-xylulose-5-phosphate reductoisomerase